MSKIASTDKTLIPVDDSNNVQSYFKPLVPEAEKQLLRIMKNSRNEKVVANVATTIIEKAEGKQPADSNSPVVIINAEKMVLVTNTLKELMNGG